MKPTKMSATTSRKIYTPSFNLAKAIILYVAVSVIIKIFKKVS